MAAGAEEPEVLRTIDGPLDDTVPAARPITPRDLLTFRSGYGEVMFVAGFCPLLKAMMEAQLPLATWPFPGTADELMKHLGSLRSHINRGQRRTRAGVRVRRWWSGLDRRRHARFR
jgi:hypothetical protein